MRRYVHTILASLLCACLLVSYAPLPASAAGAAGPSVGEAGRVQATGPNEAQASTTVSVFTVGLTIAGKTHDVTASLDDILKDAALPADERLYVLKVLVEGADPAACDYAWTREAKGSDGSWKPDDGFFDDAPAHALVDDARAGLLEEGAAYRYTVTVADPATGQSESASIQVEVSKVYLDRTLSHASGISVSGALLRAFEDADLAVAGVEPGSPTYGFLQQAAEGLDVRSAWQLALPAGPGDEDPFRGTLEVSLPVDVAEGQTVQVVALLDDGGTISVAATVAGGAVTVETPALGAFAVAVQPARTYKVTAEAGPGGSVSPAGETSYAEGAEPVYTFLPDEGFALGAVEVDGRPVEAQGNSYRFAPLTADHALRVTFAKVPVEPEKHRVFARVFGGADGHGLVSLDGIDPSVEQEVEAAHGSSVLVSFHPEAGYVLDAVTVATGGGDPVPVVVTGDSFLLSAVEADTVVEASFRPGAQPPVPVHVVTAEIAAGEGGVSPERVEILHGGGESFAFSPAAGWRLAKVTLDGADVTSRVENGVLTLQNVVDDHKIAVEFERIEPAPTPSGFVAVTASAGPGGVISPVGEVVVPQGGSQTFYFLPDDGKKVAALTVDGKRMAFSGSSYTLFGIEADASVAVEFEDAPGVTPAPSTHVLSIDAGPGGSVSPAGEVRVIDGGSLLLALLPEEGFEVDEVSVDGATVQRGGTSCRVTDVRGDAAVHVSFKRSAELDGPLVQVAVDVKAGVEAGRGGSVSPSGTLSLAYGSSQTFYVYPAEGYVLESVQVDGEEVEAQPVAQARQVALFAMGGASGAHGAYRFTVADVRKDMLIEVAFRELVEGEQAPDLVQTHEVRASSTAGGMISPAGSSWVVDGGSMTFALKADEGFRLASLLADGRDVTDQVAGGVFELSDVRGDLTVEAAFERVAVPDPAPSYVTVHASSSEGGAISPEGDVRAAKGGSQTFAFIPDDGYVLDRVEVDGREVVPIDGVYTMFDLAADARIHAEFRLRTAADPEPVLPETRTVTASASPGGSVAPAGATKVALGGSLALAFAPDEGYRLAYVALDDVDVTGQVVDGVLNLTGIVEDCAVCAEFEKTEEPAPPAKTYVVTASVKDGKGRVSPEGAVQVAEGASPTFYFHPDAGWAVAELEVDGRTVAWTAGSYAFSDMRADHTLAVTFKRLPAPIPGDDGTSSGSGLLGGKGPLDKVSAFVKTGDGTAASVAVLALATLLAAVLALVAATRGRTAGFGRQGALSTRNLRGTRAGVGKSERR